MNRFHLEHIIRASGAITEEREFVIVGSSAILALIENPPEDLFTSMEVDIYPKDNPEKAIIIDGAIGENSPFHDTFKYYAHGIGPETAALPENWKERLIAVKPEKTEATGYCLHPLDLAISKLAAGRNKDFEFIRKLIEYKIIDRTRIETAIHDEIGSRKLKTKLENNLKYI